MTAIESSFLSVQYHICQELGRYVIIVISQAYFLIYALLWFLIMATLICQWYTILRIGLIEGHKRVCVACVSSEKEQWSRNLNLKDRLKTKLTLTILDTHPLSGLVWLFVIISQACSILVVTSFISYWWLTGTRWHVDWPVLCHIVVQSVGNLLLRLGCEIHSLLMDYWHSVSPVTTATNSCTLILWCHRYPYTMIQ